MCEGTGCELYKSCNNPFIKMEGNILSEVLFVGEAPGEREDSLGRPFVGKSGEILRRAIIEAELEPNGKHDFNPDSPPILTNVAITNVVACRPPNNETPKKIHIQACFPKVLEIIKQMPNLKIIIPVGNIALRAFTGKQGISTVSGTLMEWNGYKLMPLIHPASILHSKDRRKLHEFRQHVKRIKEFLGANVSIKTVPYELIDNVSKLEKLKNEIVNDGYFVFDLETTGLNPYKPNSRIRCISISTKTSFEHGVSYIIPLDSYLSDWLTTMELLRSIFESQSTVKVAHNCKFDILWLRAILGITVNGDVEDTMISQYLLHQSASMDLKQIAWDFGYGGYERILPDETQNCDGDPLYKYSATDVYITHKLYLKHKEDFASLPQSRLAYNILVEVSRTLAKVEDNGIYVDLQYLANVSYNKAIKVINNIVKAIRNEEIIKKYEQDNDIVFNPNSHAQIKEVMFNEKYLSLQPIKTTTKTGSPATDKDVLQYYAPFNKVVSLLHTYSEYVSVSKFVKTIIDNVTPDCKLHTTFWLTKTRSGRSSSSDPNLQNLPKGSRDILKIRDAFVAPPNYIIAEFDNNQIELRCMAEEAQDDVLRDAVLSGDVHRATASFVLGKKPEDITEEERRNVGKVMNFQIIYGATEYGVARVMKCDLDKARQYLANFFRRYYKTKMWMDKIIEQVKTHGYVDTRTGLRRYFPNYYDKSIVLTDHEIRSAINTPIQGLAGHILFIQLAHVDRFLELSRLRSRIVLEIHDSIVIMLHKDEMEIIPAIKHIMEKSSAKILNLTVPIEVGIKIGGTLGSLKDYEEVQDGTNTRIQTTARVAREDSRAVQWVQ